MTQRLVLDCYWVGSVDLNFFLEIKGFSTKPPKSFQLFAGGSLQQPRVLKAVQKRRIQLERRNLDLWGPCLPQGPSPLRILKGLKFLHSQGVIHRDIKACAWLFRARQMAQKYVMTQHLLERPGCQAVLGGYRRLATFLGQNREANRLAPKACGAKERAMK